MSDSTYHPIHETHLLFGMLLLQGFAVLLIHFASLLNSFFHFLLSSRRSVLYFLLSLLFLFDELYTLLLEFSAQSCALVDFFVNCLLQLDDLLKLRVALPGRILQFADGYAEL